MPANKNIYGAIWVLIAALCFASMNAIAKEIPRVGETEIPALQLAFARYAVAAMVLFPFIISRRVLWKPSYPERYIVRTISGFGGIVLMFIAVRHVPLAAATAIGFTSPIFAMLFAAVFLLERLNGRQWAIACLGLAGALVVARPDATSISWAGLIPLAAAVFMGAEVVAIKWLSQARDHAITIIFYSNVMGATFSFLGALSALVTPTQHQIVLMIFLGAAAVAGQFCVLQGVRLAEASFLAPFFYASLVYSTLFGYVFFAETPTTTTACGCILILTSAFLLTRETKPRRSQYPSQI